MADLPTNDDFRDAFANVVLQALRDECSWDGDKFEMSATTSGCPLIQATFGGAKFNLTITRAQS